MSKLKIEGWVFKPTENGLVSEDGKTTAGLDAEGNAVILATQEHKTVRYCNHCEEEIKGQVFKVTNCPDDFCKNCYYSVDIGKR